MSSTNVNTSPERPHPKQYQDCICGLTLKLGLSSWWKGHRPQRSLLRFVSRTCSETTLTRSTLTLTSAKASSDDRVGTTRLCVAKGPRIHHGRVKEHASAGARGFQGPGNAVIAGARGSGVTVVTRCLNGDLLGVLDVGKPRQLLFLGFDAKV